MIPWFFRSLRPGHLIWLFGFLPLAQGQVELPVLFSDHLVLQRDVTVRVWGRARPSAEVTVSLAGQNPATRAGADGQWELKLHPLPAGGPHVLSVTDGTHVTTLRDVLVGDVWFCSGQSNLAFEVSRSQNSDREIAAARDSAIREFHVAAAEAAQPAGTAAGTWSPASPETVGRFSAVGYYFARAYRQAHPDVPIGIIRSAWGGSVIEAWMSRAVQEGDPSLLPITARIDRERARYHEAFAVYEKQASAYKAASRQAGSTPPAEKPRPPARVTGYKHDIGVLFNGMVHPFKNYAVRGVVWYQGESNTGRPAFYARQLELLIGEWRRLWQRDDLPFVIVQLPRIGNSGGQSWPWLREAQASATRLPQTALVVTIDTGAVTNEIHPPDKQAVGARVAQVVRRRFDHEEVPAFGPSYRGLTVESTGALRLHFDPNGPALAVRDGGAPTGFVIAGADGRFVPAEAQIEGYDVLVRSPAVARPEAARYAWSNLAEGNLINTDRLPAAPFRTDRLPLKITRGTASAED